MSDLTDKSHRLESNAGQMMRRFRPHPGHRRFCARRQTHLGNDLGDQLVWLCFDYRATVTFCRTGCFVDERNLSRTLIVPAAYSIAELTPQVVTAFARILCKADRKPPPYRLNGNRSHPVVQTEAEFALLENRTSQVSKSGFVALLPHY